MCNHYAGNHSMKEADGLVMQWGKVSMSCFIFSMEGMHKKQGHA